MSTTRSDVIPGEDLPIPLLGSLFPKDAPEQRLKKQSNVGRIICVVETQRGEGGRHAPAAVALCNDAIVGGFNSVPLFYAAANHDLFVELALRPNVVGIVVSPAVNTTLLSAGDQQNLDGALSKVREAGKPVGETLAAVGMGGGAAAAVVATEKPKPDMPRPQVMAIMRNGHEVLRGALTDIRTALDAGDAADFSTQWKDFQKWHSIHAAMEDGVPGVAEGLFAFLDKEADGAASAASLDGEHEKVEEVTKAVQSAVEGSASLDELRTAYEAFEPVYEAHLKKEEDVMMPKIQALAKGGYDMKGAVRKYLMPAVGELMDFFIRFGVSVLEKHTGDQPRVRVWVHALYAVSDADEWPARHTSVRTGLSPGAYEALAKELQL